MSGYSEDYLKDKLTKVSNITYRDNPTKNVSEITGTTLNYSLGLS
jgi:hypothetical protein